jgi:carbamoyl-phosphate synthase small subunit
MLVHAGRGKTALLVLSDGSIFEGHSIGAKVDAVGELVFNTSMTGYQEALTDPSYAGQLLTFCYPLIGNYGISEEAFESSKVQPSAAIVREACNLPTHYQSRRSLDEFLEQSGVPGISGVDTRAIVRKVRSAGVMPSALVQLNDESEREAVIASALKKAKAFDYGANDYVLAVATKTNQVFNEAGAKTVVLIDVGAKGSIARELVKRGFRVVVVPPKTTAKEIMALEPAGLMVSNGPGDPATATYTIDTLKNLAGKLPIFGICLGHQLLAHTLGAKTFKLKFGHRGSNQPVLNVESGKAFITSQNHGYAVKDLPKTVSELFVNANDGTNEGLRHKELPIFSVQYHPEANPGPYDNRYLFDEFAKMLD